MYQEEKDLTQTGGTGLKGEINITYKKLVKVFGKPNAETDGYKTDAEWIVQTPHGVATIYNYKTGKNYCGDEGDEVEDITDWHIGGHNPETADYIKFLLTNKKCPDCEKYTLVDMDDYFECSDPECEISIEKCSHCYGAPEVEDTDCCMVCKMD